MSRRALPLITPGPTMSWMLVICLLGATGAFPETKSMNDIPEINKNLIPKDDPASSFLSEGDIVISVISKFSPKLFLWPLVNKTVVIPYDLSQSYDEHQRNVIFEAFKDLEASTCVRFIERTTQRDYISILPGNGCYSSVGRVGKRQVVSLAFQCLEKGKGIVLHELMHAIGFWHEHSRADRDMYVTIHWNAIRKEYWANFCKYETTNMVVKYDLESLLHYSSVAFTKSGDITIEPHDRSTHMGQRIKLSNSDMLRVNKLYHCPQYIPSEDDDEDIMVLDNPAPGVATCLEANMNDPESLSAAVFTESLTAASLSSKEELGSISLPTEESKTSPVALYSSSLEFKTGSAPTSFSSQESKLASTGSIYSTTQEPTHSTMGLSMPKGETTLDSTRGTAAPESMQVNSTVLIPQGTTEQPSTATAAPESVEEDNSTFLVSHRATEQLPIESTRGTEALESAREENSTVFVSHRTTRQPPRETAAPESVLEDNSTVLIPQGITKQHPMESGGTAALVSIHEGNSTVSILHMAIKKPSTAIAAPESLQEDISTVLIPHIATGQPSKWTAAPGTGHKDNSATLILQGATKQPIQSTIETAVTESLQDNATVLILQGTTEQHRIKTTRETAAPESVHEDNSTVLIPEATIRQQPVKPTRETAGFDSMQVNSTVLVSHRTSEQPSRGTAAPESIHHSSVVLISQGATKPHPVEPTRGIAVPESIHEDNSTVLFLYKVTEQPSTTATLESVKKNSVIFISHRATEQPPMQSFGRAAALESVHEDNSTVLKHHITTEQLPLASTQGTVASESIQDNSTLLILYRATKQHQKALAIGPRPPETLQEDSSTMLIPLGDTKHLIDSTRETSTLEAVNANNSTVLVSHMTTKHPVEYTGGTAALESVNEDNSTEFSLHGNIINHTIESPRGTAAPEYIQHNSIVLNTQNATYSLSDHSKTFTAVISSATSSKSNAGDIHVLPLESNTKTFQRLNFNGDENRTENFIIKAIFESKSSDGTTVSNIRENTLAEAVMPTSIFMQKRTMALINVMEKKPTLQISASSQASEMQQAIAEDTGSSSGSGEGLNLSQDQDEHLKANPHILVRKRSLAGRTQGSWSQQLPRWLHGNKSTYSYNNRRKSSSKSIEPFCGFEHGFCGWQQSNEDDLDWELSWGSLNVNVGHFTPEVGFHLSLKSSPEVSVPGQKALLLRPIVQPSNCISFWYSLRHSIMGTLNVYIISSGGEKTLLWTSGGQECVKWTKAQIMLPPHLLSNNVYVVVEGVVKLSDQSNIAIDNLYVGQCS